MITMIRYGCLILALCLGIKETAIENTLPVCFSDSPTAVMIHLPPVLDETQFVNKMTDLLRKKYSDWITRLHDLKALPATTWQHLTAITIRVLPVHNTIGSCVGNKIDIDEGNLLVAYNMCYADACLQQNHHELGQFNKWHDYLFDAVIQGDPITYLYGTKDFNDFIFSNGGLDSTLRDQFVVNLYSWMALLVFHEVGHIVLDHAGRWHKQYPNASLTNIASWTKEQYAYSRAMEIEADNKALDLYMNLMRYDPGSILSSYVDWQLLRSISIEKAGYAVYPTHPTVRERVRNLFTQYGKIAKLDMGTTLQMAMAYIDKYDSLTARGNLIEMPELRDKRPEKLDINMERFIIRDAQLTLDHQKTQNR